MSPYALIVEPEPTRAEGYGHLVAGNGLEAVVARDGAEAQELFRKRGPPALVILEPSLPRMDGFALLRDLRKKRDDIPVVVISAFFELRNAALKLKGELGIREVLAKSMPAMTIHRALQRTLTEVATPATSRSVRPPVRAEPPALQVSEQRRLDRIGELGLVKDGAQDAVLKDLVEQTAKAFGVPMATVTLVLNDRQWFQAHTGLTGKLAADRGTERKWSFCSHVVDGREPMVIPDAVIHPVFSDNQLVKDGLVRGYAGAPLLTPSGEVLGTLCIMDTKPLKVGAEDMDALVLLARRVAGELELCGQAEMVAPARLASSLKVASQPSPGESSSLAYLTAVLENIDAGVMLLDSERNVVFANRTLGELFGMEEGEILGLSREEGLKRLASKMDDPTELLRKMKVLSEGPFSAREEFEIHRPRRRVLRWVARPVKLAEDYGQLALYTDITAEVDLAHERERLAYTDALTQVYNRRAGEEAVEREVARAQRMASPLGFASFELRNLRELNEQLGSGAGDDFLKAISKILVDCSRATDTITRWGGASFLVVLPGVVDDGARIFCERAESALKTLDLPKPVKVAHGYAYLQTGEEAASLLLRTRQAVK